MTFLTVIMAFIYICIYITKLKDKEILKKIGISILVILCISSVFWMPMLETYFSAEYAVYQENAMATQESFNQSGLDFQSLFYTDQEKTHVFEIGISIIIMICLSVFAIKKGIPNLYKKEYILFLILGLICTIITINKIPWGIFGKIFQIIQFKWRMLAFSNFFFAIICAINMGIIIRNFNLKDVIIISTISLLYVMTLTSFIPRNQEIQEITQYTIGDVTENKREVIRGMGRGEYLPVRANDNREYIREREDTVYVIKGVRRS